MSLHRNRAASLKRGILLSDMAQEKTLDEAANELATLVHRHLAGLSPAAREKNISALEKATAKIGDTCAKSAAPRGTRLVRAAALRRA